MMGRTLFLPPSNPRYIHSFHDQLCQRYVSVTLCRSFHSSWICAQEPKRQLQSFAFSKFKGIHPLTMATFRSVMPKQLHLGLSTRYHSMSIRFPLPGQKNSKRTNWHKSHISWGVGGSSLGLCLSFKTWGSVHAEASDESRRNNEHGGSQINTSHGKKIYTDYSITGIPGDGRCLFRSVMHGACIRSGKGLPDENLRRKLADELRTKVADEFIKRRAETEWFIEGDFDAYVSQMRKPHVWGGEPELFMASHVLQMPITVYMLDKDAGGLIAIAEYGQEYGKEDPIQVLYHGFGHYDALQIPSGKASRSKL